jgi:hypothetical protein
MRKRQVIQACRADTVAYTPRTVNYTDGSCTLLAPPNMSYSGKESVIAISSVLFRFRPMDRSIICDDVHFIIFSTPCAHRRQGQSKLQSMTYLTVSPTKNSRLQKATKEGPWCGLALRRRADNMRSRDSNSPPAGLVATRSQSPTHFKS